MRKNILLSLVLYVLFILLHSSTLKITVISPNGGEQFSVKEKVIIKWDYPNGKDVIIILYREGIKFRTISESVSNSGSFVWDIPSNIPFGDQYRIRVRSKQNLSVNDFSDGNFSIKKK